MWTSALSCSHRVAVLFALCAVSLAMQALEARAAALPANTTAFAVPEPDAGISAGTVVAGGVPVPFVAATFTGTLTSTVIAGDTSNPYGGLTFVYQVTSAVGIPSGEIDRVTVNGYAGFLVDASYQSPPLAGLAPTINNRSASGDVVGFSFIGFPVGPGTVQPGMTSALLVLQTDAQFYQPTVASVIDGSVAMVSSFSPAVPEPGTLTLGLFGLGALMLYALRRRRSARSFHYSWPKTRISSNS
jgi:hypothetical protein